MKDVSKIFDLLSKELRKKGIKGKAADRIIFKFLTRLDIPFNRIESEKEEKVEELKKILGKKRSFPCEDPVFDEWRRIIVIGWSEPISSEEVRIYRVEYHL